MSQPPYENVAVNYDLTTRSFASASGEFSFSMENKIPTEVSCSSHRNDAEAVVEEKYHAQTFKRLKELHHWADSSLIEDIMTAVDNDFTKASDILNELAFSESFKESDVAGMNSNCGGCLDYGSALHRDENVVSEEILEGLKQRETLDLKPDLDNKAEAYLQTPSTLTSQPPYENIVLNNDHSTNSFASVFLPSGEFSSSLENKNHQKATEVGCSSHRNDAEVVVEEKYDIRTFKRLKELHHWVDSSLIEDIMTAVDNDFNEASDILNELAFSEIFKESDVAGMNSNCGGCLDCGSALHRDENVVSEEILEGLKQREKLDLKPDLDNDSEAYLQTPCALTSQLPYENIVLNNDHSTSSFASVFSPLGEFSSSLENKNHQKATEVGCSSHRNDAEVVVEEKYDIPTFKKRLKELHHWADSSLIEDIMTAVDNDFNEASDILNELAFSEIFKESDVAGMNSNCGGCLDCGSALHRDENVVSEEILEGLKQREKLDLKPDLDNKTEAYLQTPSTLTSQLPYENIVLNNDHSTSSFASVFLPSGEFSSSLENKNHQKPTEVGCSSHRNDAEVVVEEKYDIQTFKRLKELHHWADSSLIEDIMTAVDNDFKMASDILNELAFSGSVKESDVAGMNSNFEDCLDYGISLYRDKNALLDEILEGLKQGEKVGLKPDLDNKAEAYLQTPSTLTSQPPYENIALNSDHSTNSFASVFLPSGEFSSSLENKNHQKATEVGCSSHRNDAEVVVEEKYDIPTFKRLKELHHWADSSLIEDIMTAVDNDFNEASDILKELAFSEIFKESDVAGMNSNCGGCLDYGSALHRDENVISEEILEGLKQREKLDLKPDLDNNSEAYLQTPCALTSQLPYENIALNNDHSMSSFASVFFPSGEFSSSLENKNHQKATEVGCSSRRNDAEVVVEEKYDIQFFKRLKELHHWADSSLIEDIMTTVDNDFKMSSDILNELAFSGSVKNIKESDVAGMNSNSEGCLDYGSAFYRDENFLSEEILEGFRSVLEDCLSGKNERYTSECLPHEKKLSDEADCMALILEQLRSLPVKPEWEQDDVYLSRRKDAIRIMRLASQHSKAAANAYARGDHGSAKQFSLMARNERTSAKMLHAKAAKEILSIKNRNHDAWKLDLHGLHAAEAVEALKEHLHIIEALVTLNQSVSPSRDKVNAGNAGAFSAGSYGFVDMEKFDEQQPLSKQRPKVLEVITGRGKHSQGQAVLPTFIKAFLDGNGYLYDEARAGVIMVRPKFGQM